MGARRVYQVALMIGVEAKENSSGSTLRLLSVGLTEPKTWYLDTIGRFPKNSWWGVAGMSSSLSKPRTGITLKIRHAYVKARYINVSGSRACTSNDRPILETVCQVRSARWFWYCFFGAASVSCIPASLQYVENSAEVNWLPASA
jgi:hypothetical protein